MKKIIYISLGLLLSTMFVFTACDEKGDPPGPIELNDEQTASVSMRGKWGLASDAVLPFGTTEGVLNDLILEFRISDDYYPSDFTSTGADYFFGGSEDGAWNWDNSEFTDITLTNISPVGNIHVMKEGSQIRVVFMYEGEEGGRSSGLGEYAVTLQKIAP